MSKHTKFLLGATLTALLSACGGGGGGSAEVVPAPTPTPTPEAPASADLLPLQYSSYPANTQQSFMFDQLNAARVKCGFGGLRHDSRLDKSAQSHADWLVRNGYGLSHFEVPETPGFTGVLLADRLKAQGYAVGFESSHSGSNVRVAISGEGLGGKTVENSDAYRSFVPEQLAVVYHSIGALRGYKDLGFGIAKGSSFGQPAKTYIAHNSGSETVSQKLAAGEVKTYPCDGMSSLWTFHPDETPNPLSPRDLNANPPGHPVVMLSRWGTKLTEIAVVMQHATTGADVPMAAVRTMDNDTSGLMLRNEAFAIPNVELAKNTSYKVKVTGKVDGKSFENNFTFTTGTYDKAAQRAGRFE